jgi:hypothetical protein
MDGLPVHLNVPPLSDRIEVLGSAHRINRGDSSRAVLCDAQPALASAGWRSRCPSSAGVRREATAAHRDG